MAKLSKNTKVIIGILCVLFLIRASYIVIANGLQIQCDTLYDYDINSMGSVSGNRIEQSFIAQEQKLSKVELCFKDVPADAKGKFVVSILDDASRLIYQTNISISTITNNEWKQVYINATLSPGKIYRITIDNEATNYTTTMYVERDVHAEEIVTSIIEEEQIDEQIAINYGYSVKPSVLERGLFIVYWLMLFGILVMMTMHYNSLACAVSKFWGVVCDNYGKKNVLLCVQFLLCAIIINCSGISFQVPLKIILYVISIVSVVVSVKYEMPYMSTQNRVLYILLCIYVGFAMVGQRLLLYPIDKAIHLREIFVFCCAVLWAIFPLCALLILFEICHKKIKKTKNHKRITLMVCWLFLTIPAIINLIALNPGISSQDTYTTMITNAKHIYGMQDWHPAFYCLILDVIEHIWDSTYAVIIWQLFFWTYVMMEFVVFLKNKDVKDGILIGLTFVLGFNTANYLHIITIWKDIPYTLSLVWFFVICARIILENKANKKWYLYGELIFSLVGICMFRKNGIATYIVLVIACFVYMKKNVKMIVSLLASILIVLFIKGPIYNYFNVENQGHYGMYIGLGQDILGVYYANGNVSNETLEIINAMTYYNNNEYGYETTWSRQSPDIDVEPIVFVKNYIQTFVNNPIKMMRTILNREDGIWDILQGKGVYMHSVGYTGENTLYFDDWTDYYPGRRPTSIYDGVVDTVSYTTNSQWISAIIWRCGFLSLVSAMATFYMIINKKTKKIWLLITPVWAQIISLVLSTGWADFRYFWPINLLNILYIVLVCFVEIEERSDDTVLCLGAGRDGSTV